MKFPWFRRTGVIYIPTTFLGWTILLAAIIYAVYSFLDIDSRSHSVSDTLMNFVFSLLIIVAVYTLIGFLTSRTKKNNIPVYF